MCKQRQRGLTHPLMMTDPPWAAAGQLADLASGSEQGMAARLAWFGEN